MTFLLDTSVLSALMSAEPAAQAAAWAGQPTGLLFTIAINQAEILSGLAVMPAGYRRSGLEAAASAMFLEYFDGRILPFDGMAAALYAEILRCAGGQGGVSGAVDLVIAAIAGAQDAIVVTRNASGFDECRVAIINPWDVSPESFDESRDGT